MSDNEHLTKSQRKRRRKAEKRKASSPLESNSNSSVRHISDTACSKPQGVTKPATDQNFYNSSYSYVAHVINPNTSPVMNFNQQIPYGFNSQSPTIFSASTPMAATSGNVTPPWATEIITDIKSLTAVIPKIDNIEKSLATIHLKLSEFDTRMTAVAKKVTEIETSCSFISDENDERKKEYSSV